MEEEIRRLSSSEIPSFLFHGLEEILDPKEFYKKAEKTKREVFSDIINRTYYGGIRWGRVIDSKVLDWTVCSLRYSAETTYVNMYNQQAKLPLTLSFSYDKVGKQAGYLYLGEGKEGDLCIDTAENESLKTLVKEHFKINLSKDTIR